MGFVMATEKNNIEMHLKCWYVSKRPPTCINVLRLKTLQTNMFLGQTFKCYNVTKVCSLDPLQIMNE